MAIIALASRHDIAQLCTEATLAMAIATHSTDPRERDDATGRGGIYIAAAFCKLEDLFEESEYDGKWMYPTAGVWSQYD